MTTFGGVGLCEQGIVNNTMVLLILRLISPTIGLPTE